MTLIQWLYQCLKAWSVHFYGLHWEDNKFNHKVECRLISSGPLLMTPGSQLVEILYTNSFLSIFLFSSHVSFLSPKPPFSLMFPSSFLDDGPPCIPVTSAAPFFPSMTYFFHLFTTPLIFPKGLVFCNCVLSVKNSALSQIVPHRAAGQWCGKPCTGGTWQWKGWGTTGRHTCVPPSSAPGSVTKGLEAVPVRADQRIAGEETCKIKQHVKDNKEIIMSFQFYINFHWCFIESCLTDNNLFQERPKNKEMLQRHNKSQYYIPAA